MRSTDNRQYDMLLCAAVERLRGQDLREIAARIGAEYDGAGIALECFGTRLHVDGETFRAEPAMDMWLHLALLQYLASADGSLPGDSWISLADVPGGGASRGASFDREIDSLIAEKLGKRGPEAIRAACGALGAGFREDARSDLSAVFRFAPNYPLRLNLWFADDEFPASGKVLVNAGVCRCLELEVAGTVAVTLVRMLCEEANSKSF